MPYIKMKYVPQPTSENINIYIGWSLDTQSPSFAGWSVNGSSNISMEAVINYCKVLFVEVVIWGFLVPGLALAGVVVVLVKLWLVVGI